MIIALEDLFAALAERRRINRAALRTIIWTWRGRPIQVPAELYAEFVMTGLCNVDFGDITLRELCDD